MPSTTQNPRRRALSSESGSIIVLTALSMVVLLGILAFAVDASFLYTERNRMASAADAAAKSGALEAQRGVVNLQPFVYREVTLHGFDPGGTTTVQWHRPPVSGAFSGNSHYVEVLVSQPTNTFFARGANAAFGTVTPVARAVAGVSAPQNCLVTKSFVDVKNNTSLTGCDMAVGGDLSTDKAITGTPPPNISVTGTCSGSCGNVVTGQPTPGDPLAGLQSPGTTGYVTGVGCPAGIPAVLDPLPGGCYTNIPSSIHNLQTGAAFQVSGQIDVSSGGTLTGNNVLLYMTSTAVLNPGNNATVNLSAQTTGAYQGIAIYGDPGAVIDGNNQFTLNVNGAIYMPGTDLDAKNNIAINAVGGCLLVVLNSYTAKNNGGLTATNSGCFATYGGAAFLSVSLAE